jgi:hypothetical protein
MKDLLSREKSTFRMRSFSALCKANCRSIPEIIDREQGLKEDKSFILNGLR